MKKNKYAIATDECFEIQKRTTDKWFNATNLIEQWNKALRINYTVDKFINNFIHDNIKGKAVEEINGNVFLHPAFESQLRLDVAGYDFELSELLEPTLIAWQSVNFLNSNKDDTYSHNRPQQTYLMIDDATGLIKIGRSSDPIFREKTLCSQTPLIRLIAMCPEDIEKQLHDEYKDKRIRGEWFKLSGEDIKFIIKHYKFKKNKKK